MLPEKPFIETAYIRFPEILFVCSMDTLRTSFAVIAGIAVTLLLSCSATRNRAALKSERFTGRGQSILFKSDGYLLKGKIITNAPAGQKVPLLVFCVGSGTSSWQSNYATFIDTVFLQTLPMDSLALLVFDKRGVGESEGRWQETSFEERAADAKAAADYAKTLPYIDSSRIFITGHSQGGWIAEIALALYPETFAGGISLAGPAYSVREQLINDYWSQFQCRNGMSSEKAATKAKSTTSRIFTVAALFPFNANLRQLKRIRRFDPEPYLLNIRKPFALFFGENDPLVNPAWNKQTLTLLFRNHLPPHFDTVTIKGANHSFKLADLCYNGSSSAVTYAPAFRAAFLAWVRSHVLP